MLFNNNLSLENMAATRLIKGRNALLARWAVLSFKSIPIMTRLDVIRAVIIPTLLYGVELWGTYSPNLVPAQRVVNDAIKAVFQIGSDSHIAQWTGKLTPPHSKHQHSPELHDLQQPLLRNALGLVDWHTGPPSNAKERGSKQQTRLSPASESVVFFIPPRPTA